eukprot:TRINITY_DN22192_c0_g1_i1.p1 TRINITY_DN22192_c0_g1~~TRINITY_DN22192_c0_g1_i1.p1  ORF type:complete len:556 (+),score=69.96 TRINITY_DN22192_c0_g1_i1:136-1803(+)
MPQMRSKSATNAIPAGLRAAQTPPDSPTRRGGASSRARSVAALLLKTNSSNVFQPSCPAVLQVAVESVYDVAVRVTIQGGKADGTGLPDICPAGETTSATFVSLTPCRGAMTKGSLAIEYFEERIPIGVAHSDMGSTFVHSKGRWRHTALSAPHWNWRDQEEKPTEGKAADIEVDRCRHTEKPHVIRVSVRQASENELKRCLHHQALREAQEDRDYDMLHAQVTKARQAGVDLHHIEAAEETLRELRKLKLHISPGCEKETLQSQLVWKNISRLDGKIVNERCQVSAECPCNVEENAGEVLSIVPNAVQSCLQSFGQDGDRILFEELASSALAVEEGSVWKAGGKFVFSAFDRNQSVTALTRMLHGAGRARCAQMILQMVKHSEAQYGGYVTAIQINFHPHGGTYHAQHRDIYSAKQRAGPSCTCSFKKAVGTVCYSVGSSRVCLLETCTDTFSAVKPCSDGCQGRRERRWLHSGDAMYFNEAWNANHTHGIPQIEDGHSHGPRISVAFLLGAEDSRVNLYQLQKSEKQRPTEVQQLPNQIPEPQLPNQIPEPVD